MSDYTLNNSACVYPTPAGAYYAVSNSPGEKSRMLIQYLLSLEQTPGMSDRFASDITEATGLDAPIELLYHLQEMKYVSGIEKPLSVPVGTIEDLVADRISTLSPDSRALLSDDHGLHIATSGFHHETASELAALSAQLGDTYERRRGVLQKNLGFESAALGLIDSSGNSLIGFWPLYIGKNRFSLIVNGQARFNQHSFTELIWILVRRYGASLAEPQGSSGV